MDFLKFAIAGELLVVSTCNLYQTNLCQVDYRSRILEYRTYIVLHFCCEIVIVNCYLLRGNCDFLARLRYALYRVPSSFVYQSFNDPRLPPHIMYAMLFYFDNGHPIVTIK